MEGWDDGWRHGRERQLDGNGRGCERFWWRECERFWWRVSNGWYIKDLGRVEDRSEEVIKRGK